MFKKVVPKSLRDKYDKSVLEKAIAKTKYDLNKQNLSFGDISKKKREAMVARNIEVIKAGHKSKGWMYASHQTYSSKLWPSINVSMINKNIFRYTLKTKNKCITFGNRQRNFNLPNFLPKV